VQSVGQFALNENKSLKPSSIRRGPDCPPDAARRRAAAALDRRELLAIKSLHELLRVRRLLKAIDVKPLAIVTKGMASRAQRQVSAEFVYLIVAIAFAEARGEDDLERPAPINCRRRLLAFASHARTAA
jgi:hypothetical protein